MIHLLIASLMITSTPEWREGDPAKLIQAGGAGPILVFVHASWCGPCNQLRSEVLDNDKGRGLLKRKRGISVDFDQAVGRRVTTQYRVLSLPTLLVLDASGKETGRVEGYSNADEWLQQVDNVLAGDQAMERLQARVADAPGDLDARLNLAHAQLSHGQIEVAQSTLRQLYEKLGTTGARAARMWGRYLVRVKKDGVAGAAHYAAMKRLYRGTEFRSEFLYWEAQALALQGKINEALALFEEWALDDPRGIEPLLYKASYMVRQKQDPAALEELRSEASWNDSSLTRALGLGALCGEHRIRIGAYCNLRG